MIDFWWHFFKTRKPFKILPSLKAFTLVEMMIVIGVVGILMGIVLNISWDTVDTSFAQTEKEKFLTRYNDHLTHSLSTKRHQGQQYSGINITFASWSQQVNAIYSYTDGGSGQEIFLFERVFLYTQDNAQVNVLLQPYSFDCSVKDAEEEVFSGYISLILPETLARFCFTFSPHTCKLQTIPCGEWPWLK